jgi:hypothetical protein
MFSPGSTVHAETLSGATPAPIRALHPFGYGCDNFTVTDSRVGLVIRLGTEGSSRASETGPGGGAGPGAAGAPQFSFLKSMISRAPCSTTAPASGICFVITQRPHHTRAESAGPSRDVAESTRPAELHRLSEAPTRSPTTLGTNAGTSCELSIAASQTSFSRNQIWVSRMP